MNKRERRTVPIDTLRLKANTALRPLGQDGSGTADDRREYRRGIASMLEVALHEANAYHGFRYLEGHEAVQSGDYDDTRRYYH